MKFYRLYFIFILTAFVSSAYAQKCYKKDFADENLLGEYDYRGQSYYNTHKSGDTVKVNAVIYAKQDYRIFVVTDQDLGKFQFKIIGQTKAIKSEVKEVVKKTTPKGIITDTVWARTAYTTTAVVFDNFEYPDEIYWETRTDKTGLVTIQVILPAGQKATGCVQVMVGRKFSSATLQKQTRKK